MTNNQETNTTDVEKAFEEDFKKTRNNISADSLQGLIALNFLDNSKEAFKAFFTAGARSRDKEIVELKIQRDIALQDLVDEAKEVDQLREDLKWATRVIEQHSHIGGYANGAKEIRKRHGLDKEEV